MVSLYTVDIQAMIRQDGCPYHLHRLFARHYQNPLLPISLFLFSPFLANALFDSPALDWRNPSLLLAYMRHGPVWSSPRYVEPVRNPEMRLRWLQEFPP